MSWLNPHLDPFLGMDTDVMGHHPAFFQHSPLQVFTGHNVYHVYNTTKIFPTLYHAIDLPETAYRLIHKLKARNVNQQTALRTLIDLFAAVKQSSGGTDGFRALVIHHLQESLSKDMAMFDFHEGLSRSRRRFMVLAAFAKLTGSTVLASALANFFFSCEKHIVGKERSRYLIQWGLVIMDIEGLLAEADTWNCFRALSFCLPNIRRHLQDTFWRDRRVEILISRLKQARVMDLDFGYEEEFFRGRTPRKAKCQLFDAPRSLSMLPYYHHHPHFGPPSPHLLTPRDSRLLGPLTPTLELSLPSSPFMGGYAGDPAVDELAIRQERLENQVAGIQIQVNDAARYFV